MFRSPINFWFWSAHGSTSASCELEIVPTYAPFIVIRLPKRASRETKHTAPVVDSREKSHKKKRTNGINLAADVHAGGVFERRLVNTHDPH